MKEIRLVLILSILLLVVLTIFFRINQSPDYKESSITGLVAFEVDQYYVKSLSSDYNALPSEAKFEELKEIYDRNDPFKTTLNLPSNVDFGFKLVFSGSDEIEALKPIPSKREVAVKYNRIEVIRKDGSLKFADLITYVW